MMRRAWEHGESKSPTSDLAFEAALEVSLASEVMEIAIRGNMNIYAEVTGLTLDAILRLY